MAETSKVEVQFGGDAAGLASAAAVAKAQLAAFNAELKKLAKEVASGAANDNLTKQLRAAAAGAAKAKAEINSLSGAFQKGKGHAEGHASAIGLNRMQAMEFAHVARSLADEVAAGGSIFRGLAMESGRLTQALSAGPGGVAGSVQALGGIVVRWMPLIAAAAGVATAALVALAGSKVQEDLVKLGETMRQVGLSANQVKGAEILGAKAGVDAEAMAKGLQQANQQYEALRRNTGELKDLIEKFDKPFLKVISSAKNSAQAIDMVAQEIRKLPREEGLDLAKALFGDETGEKLYGPIMRAQIGIQQFAAAAKAAGIDLKDGPVHEAEELQHQIDAAAVAAKDRLLSAMAPLGVTIGKLKVEFMEFSASIAEAANHALTLVQNLNRTRVDGETAGAAIARLGKGEKLPAPLVAPTGELIAPPEKVEAAGVPQKRYASYDPASSTKEAASQIQTYLESLQKAAETAKAELATWGLGNVERAKAVALAGAEAAARKEGRALTEKEKQDAVDQAVEAQKAKNALDDLKAAQQALNSVVNEFSNDLINGLDSAIIKGQKLHDVLKNLLQTLASSALKSVLTGVLTGGASGTLAGAIGGGPSASGGTGGLFGFLLGALPKFDVGTNSVPFDMPAIVHKNEMIVPAGQAAAWRDGGGAPSVTINNNVAGAQVIPEISRGEMIFHIESRIARNNVKQGQAAMRSI